MHTMGLVSNSRVIGSFLSERTLVAMAARLLPFSEKPMLMSCATVASSGSTGADAAAAPALLDSAAPRGKPSHAGLSTVCGLFGAYSVLRMDQLRALSQALIVISHTPRRERAA